MLAAGRAKTTHAGEAFAATAQAAQAAEQGIEEVAEIRLLASPAAAAAGAGAGAKRSPLPARWWPKFLSCLPVAAQLIIGGAFFGIAQHFMGLGDFLEALFGMGFLADVRVILARQPAISLLDLLG